MSFRSGCAWILGLRCRAVSSVSCYNMMSCTQDAPDGKHVRVVGMDFLSRGFYDEWRVNRSFDFDWMDRLDQFISKLRDT